ncbi:MAG: hypothetical protein AAF152_07055 [Cyanobacteria bacterium P01_A01_bin.114]
MNAQTCPYPLRSLIRHKAMAQIRMSEAAYKASIPWDQTLFKDLADTLLDPRWRVELRRRHVSRAAAAAVEDRLADTLANTYQTVQKQRQSALVQKLNALL